MGAEEEDVPDGPRSWAVAFAGCAVMCCISWTFRCSGALYVAFIADFGVSREQASWPLSLFSITGCVTGPLAGLLVHHFTTRSLCAWATVFATLAVFVCHFATTMTAISIWLGVIQGACSSFHYTLTSPLVASHFKQYRTTAIGILYAGPALGSFIFLPFFRWTYQEYGLRGSFLVFSGIVLNALPFVMIMRDPIRRSSTSKPKSARETDVGSQSTHLLVAAYAEKKATDGDQKARGKAPGENWINGYKQKYEPSNTKRTSPMPVLSTATFVFGKPMFYVIGLTSMVIGYNNTTVLNVLVDFAIDQDVRASTAVFLLTAYGVGDLVGRLGSGWITDRRYLTRCKMMVVENLLLGALLEGMSQARGVGLLMTITFAFACASGSALVLFTDLLKDYLGAEWIALAAGWMSFFGGLLLLTKPLLIGYFRDSIGSYVTMFALQGVSSILCSAMWAGISLYEFWTDNPVDSSRRKKRFECAPPSSECKSVVVENGAGHEDANVQGTKAKNGYC